MSDHADHATTWQHAAPVRWLQAQPVERRHTVLAAVFALVAAVWAPLGVLAFLTRSTSVFLLATVVVLVLVGAPRPVLTGGEAGATVARLVAWARRRLRRDVARSGARLRDVVGGLRARASQRQRGPSSPSASS